MTFELWVFSIVFYRIMFSLNTINSININNVLYSCLQITYNNVKICLGTYLKKKKIIRIKIDE